MPVKIFILSGARSGQQLAYDGDHFKAGSDPSCELFFDPALDAAAKNRTAVFRREADGWYVRNVGAGQILLNQQAIKITTRVRSGDIVRMSEQGPDFSFTIAARMGIPAFEASEHAGSPSFAAAPEVSAPLTENPTASAGVTSKQSPPTPSPQERNVVDTVESAPSGERGLAGATRTATEERGWQLVWLACGAAICIVCFVMARILLVVPRGTEQSDAQPAEVTINDSNSKRRETAIAPTQSEPAMQIKTATADTTPPPVQGGHSNDLIATSDTSQASVARNSAPDWPRIAADLKGGVMLLQVEQASGGSSFAWPFATCCAIDENTLLTSASVACEVRRLTQKQFKICAVEPYSGTRHEVQAIRVHREYVSLAEQPAQARYFDLALLTIADKITKVVPVATASDLTELDEGLPLACIGFGHDGNKITRHSRFELQTAVGSVYLLKSPPPHSADGPRSLDFAASTAPNLYGSPLVNASGKVVGIYETPISEEQHGVKNLHAMTVASSALIDAWTKNKDEKVWVSP